MLPSVIRVCCASLFLLFETLELRLALLAAYTQIAWRLFVCLCRGLFSSLSLSFYLSLSFQCPVAKPDTVSSASTSSSSGFATCCYCYPSRDASVSAICPCFLFFGVFLFLRRTVVEVCLTEEKTVGNGRGSGAGTCQNKTNQPEGKE